MRYYILAIGILFVSACTAEKNSTTRGQPTPTPDNNSGFSFLASCHNSQDYKCVEMYTSTELPEEVINQNKNNIESDNDCVFQNSRCSTNGADFSCETPAMHGMKLNFVYYQGIESTVSEEERAGLKQALCPMGFQEL